MSGPCYGRHWTAQSILCQWFSSKLPEDGYILRLFTTRTLRVEDVLIWQFRQRNFVAGW